MPKVAHLEESVGAVNVELADDIVARLDKLIKPETVSGPRYPAATQAEINTEKFQISLA